MMPMKELRRARTEACAASWRESESGETLNRRQRERDIEVVRLLRQALTLAKLAVENRKGPHD